VKCSGGGLGLRISLPYSACCARVGWFAHIEAYGSDSEAVAHTGAGGLRGSSHRPLGDGPVARASVGEEYEREGRGGEVGLEGGQRQREGHRGRRLRGVKRRGGESQVRDGN
jgi:hypothetical protein